MKISSTKTLSLFFILSILALILVAVIILKLFNESHVESIPTPLQRIHTNNESSVNGKQLTTQDMLPAQQSQLPTEKEHLGNNNKTSMPVSQSNVDLQNIELPLPFVNDKRLPTDLSPDETKHAEDIFLRERNMWAELKNLSGSIEIAVNSEPNETKIESLKGRVEFSILEENDDALNKNIQPWKYRIEITDINNSWKFYSDGTTKNTTLECKDKERENELRIVLDKELVRMLSFPHTALVPIYADELSPTGAVKQRQEFFQMLQPWLNRKANNKTDAYIFKNVYGEPRGFSLEFENGHFSKFVKKFPSGTAEASFGQYVESNNFWFPTQILFQPPIRDGKTRELKLSNITVNKLH